MTTSAGPTQLGYLGLEVSNLVAWREYATQVLGLEVETTPETTYLRMDDYSYRIALHEGPRDDLTLLGWRV